MNGLILEPCEAPYLDSDDEKLFAPISKYPNGDTKQRPIAYSHFKHPGIGAPVHSYMRGNNKRRYARANGLHRKGCKLDGDHFGGDHVFPDDEIATS